jgi:single-stranded DNA-binding protein
MGKNQLQFSGNVASPAEMKSFNAGGKKVEYCSVKVAMNHPRKQDEKPLFIEVQLFDKFSADIGLKLDKGERVYFVGELGWDTGERQTFWKLSNASFAPGWLPPKKDGGSAPSRPAVRRDEPDTGGVDDDTDLPF